MSMKRKLRIYDEDTSRKIVEQDVADPDDLRSALDHIQKSVTNTTLYLVHDARGLAGVPTDPAGQELVRSKIREYVEEEMKLALSHSDYELYQRVGMAASGAAGQRIRTAMDGVILQMAEEHGNRIGILAPPPVAERLNEWQLDKAGGPLLFEKFGHRLARHTQILAGKGKAPLKWWALRASAILQELKTLRDRIGNTSGGRIQDARVLSDVVDDALEADPVAFPTLVEIGINLHRFIQERPNQARKFFARQLTPALFRDELIGLATNREPESARQVRSRIFNKRQVRFKGIKA
jgi:hypothetical protein